MRPTLLVGLGIQSQRLILRNLVRLLCYLMEMATIFKPVLILILIFQVISLSNVGFILTMLRMEQILLETDGTQAGIFQEPETRSLSGSMGLESSMPP